MIEETSLYSTLLVIAFLDKISVAELLSVGVLIICNVDPKIVDPLILT